MLNRRRFVQSSSSLLALAMLPEATPLPASGPEAAPSHPLDPLSGSEIARTVEVLHVAGKLNENVRFATIELREPG